MHRHLCSQCGAVLALAENGKCLNNSDHHDGSCEDCAFAQSADSEGLGQSPHDQ